MKIKNYTYAACASYMMLIACGNEKPTEEGDQTTDSTMTEAVGQKPIDLEVAGIHLYEADIAKTFTDAELSIIGPSSDKVTKPGKYTFEFGVHNYQLAQQTEDADMRHCANSSKGQHIHFIHNNGPYAAHYEPSFEAELMEGNNVVLAFLSRSYHESIKSEKAYILTNYIVGEPDDEFDDMTEHMFYSRPKGTYAGADAKKILLDFYLVNLKLSKSGYKVRATINGNEFMLTKWAPYFIEGLPMGKNTIRLELIDALGELVEGPFNDSGTREIELMPAEKGV